MNRRRLLKSLVGTVACLAAPVAVAVVLQPKLDTRIKKVGIIDFGSDGSFFLGPGWEIIGDGRPGFSIPQLALIALDHGSMTTPEGMTLNQWIQEFYPHWLQQKGVVVRTLIFHKLGGKAA